MLIWQPWLALGVFAYEGSCMCCLGIERRSHILLFQMTCYLGIVVADLQTAVTHPSRLLINIDQVQLDNLHPARCFG